MRGQKDPRTPAAARRFTLFYETRSPATRRSYNPGWKRLEGFLTKKKLCFEDLGGEEAVDLLQDLDQAGASASQIATTTAVVAFACEASRSKNPFNDTMVRKIKKSLTTEATITGRTKSRMRRAMTAADYKCIQTDFWSVNSSPQDREVAVLAMLTYAAQRRLADLRMLRWGDIDITRTTVTLVIRRHKTSKFYNGAPMKVTVDGTGEADLCRVLRAWRTQIFEEAGLEGPSVWLCPRISAGTFQASPAAERTLQRSHAILMERLGLPKGKRHCPLLPASCRVQGSSGTAAGKAGLRMLWRPVWTAPSWLRRPAGAAWTRSARTTRTSPGFTHPRPSTSIWRTRRDTVMVSRHRLKLKSQVFMGLPRFDWLPSAAYVPAIGFTA